MPVDLLACEKEPLSFKAKMISIACPDTQQSEAYISTITLFLSFASTSEEKVYLRLPSVWRDLWDELSRFKQQREDAKDHETLCELRSILRSTPRVNESAVRITGETEIKSAVNGQESQAVSTAPQSLENSQMTSPEKVRATWVAREQSNSYQQMFSARSDLPIFNFKEHILRVIANHQIVIICGETGCGKSTQGTHPRSPIAPNANHQAVPAYILERELSSGRSCKIYCTEPRRISAISLAQRVSQELGEKKGHLGTAHSLVGYAIRLESRFTAQTRLIYATTGIVMRMLEGSHELGDITHIVLDEVQ